MKCICLSTIINEISWLDEQCDIVAYLDGLPHGALQVRKREDLRSERVNALPVPAFVAGAAAAYPVRGTRVELQVEFVMVPKNWTKIEASLGG